MEALEAREVFLRLSDSGLASKLIAMKEPKTHAAPNTKDIVVG